MAKILRYFSRYSFYCLLGSPLELLRRGPDDDLVDLHFGRLLDGVRDCTRDRAGRDSQFVELAQILPGRFLRTVFRDLRGDRARRDHGTPNVVGLELYP